MSLVIANEVYSISIAKENLFSKSRIKFMDICFNIYKTIFPFLKNV